MKLSPNALVWVLRDRKDVVIRTHRAKGDVYTFQATGERVTASACRSLIDSGVLVMADVGLLGGADGQAYRLSDRWSG